MFYGNSKCTYRAVTPSVRKAPEPQLLYASKSAASRYAGGGDFAIASEGIAKRLRYPLGSI